MKYILDSRYWFRGWHGAPYGVYDTVKRKASFFEESLYREHRRRAPNECTYLTGCDEEHLLPYSEFRAVQQRPDKPTLDMIEYIKNEPLIMLILTGHLHIGLEERFSPTAMQYVVAGNYMFHAAEILVT